MLLETMLATNQHLEIPSSTVKKQNTGGTKLLKTVTASIILGLFILFAVYTSSLKGSDGDKDTAMYASRDFLFEDEDTMRVSLSSTYGQPDSRAWYDIHQVVEPYRETTITVENPQDDSTFFFFRIMMEDGSSMSHLGKSFTFIAKNPGAALTLFVFEYQWNEYTGDDMKDALNDFVNKHTAVDMLDEAFKSQLTLLRTATRHLSCKYVRRELRALSKEDSYAFFSALRMMYNLDTTQGREKYGESYTSYGDILSKFTRFTNVHKEGLYYNDKRFYLKYALISQAIETTLQAIEPSLSLPYWDPSLDATKYEDNWYDQSPVFSGNMFGKGDEKKGFVINHGFTAYLKEPQLTTDEDSDAVVSYIQRSMSKCGFDVRELSLPSCDAMFLLHTIITSSTSALSSDQSTDYMTNEGDSLDSLSDAIEDKIHRKLHAMFNGPSFTCPISPQPLIASEPSLQPLIQHIVLDAADHWLSATREGLYRETSDHTSVKSVKSVKSVSDVSDVSDVSETPITSLCDSESSVRAMSKYASSSLTASTKASSSLWQILSDRYPLTYDSIQRSMRDVLSKNTQDHESNHVESISSLFTTRESSSFFKHWLQEFICHPSSIDPLVSSSYSLVDPLLFTLHNGYERLFHRLRIKLAEEGIAEQTDSLEKQQLQQLLTDLHPLQKTLPYIYASLDFDSCKSFNF
jgi:hypothetical protein